MRTCNIARCENLQIDILAEEEKKKRKKPPVDLRAAGKNRSECSDERGRFYGKYQEVTIRIHFEAEIFLEIDLNWALLAA